MPKSKVKEMPPTGEVSGRPIVDTLERSYRLEAKEISWAVELYYDAQELRVRYANKERTEQRGVLSEWMQYWLSVGEKEIYRKLKHWIEGEEPAAEAKWAYEQWGIGPVLAAGLAAHIDVAKAKTPSAVWRYAGQDPTADRPVKGKKLPYNRRLKLVCFKIGESFVKVSGKPDSLYGKLYAEFKAAEIRKNESGLYKEAAAKELRTKDFKRDTVTKARLLEGKLSDGHLHAKAKRKAVKIFLSHYWVKGREARNLEVREPYAIRVLGHDGKIEAA